MESVNTLIIGGGVIGLTIARELAKRGFRDVAVIDKQQFGREASWAAGGILAPQIEADQDDDFFRLACASRDLYPDFAAALRDETGIETGFDQTGTIYAALSEHDEAEFRARFAWQQAKRLSIEWLTGADVRAIEPKLSAQVRCALRFPNDYQIDNRQLVRALRVANENLGVRLIENCEARQLEIVNRQVTSVTTCAGSISAGAVVLAAGAWNSLIDVPAKLPQIEIKPVRGQMLTFQTAAGFARQVIFSARGYLIPRGDGRLIAGSTTEDVGFEKQLTEDGVAAIRSMAFEIAPELKEFPIVDSWAGFRPKSLDGLPVLGAPSTVKNLYYATGHYRNGILLAPITGKLLAEAIAGGAVSQLLTTFSPNRFVFQRP